MPFITLDYSANLIEKDQIGDFLVRANNALAEILQAPANAFISSAVEHKHFCIGDNSSAHAFLHIELKLMQGRSKEVLEAVGRSLIEMLKNFASQTSQKLELRTTVELIELQRPPVKENFAISSQSPLSLVF